MDGKKVACYLYGDEEQIGFSMDFDESEYKDNMVTIIPKENDKFKVTIGKENPINHLKMIKLNHISK
ncbi:hypothetical protein QOZ84_11485 [Romboutsia sedimentorum]|uniref:Uncharacterized protein n=1 Tax=Romboutsia sedimentorum TaxID=1368474 RepID=A0ABT7EDK8_9FIRM|nr:hypothetical protein [Romboutsia sedimentorum]MDK2564173.1 hypothetical protein [Romboutsia sedimentorum]